MIIHDFYVISITINPFKADSPLFIDPDAVLPCPVAAELLLSVGWRDAEVAQRDGIVEHAQLAVADLLVSWAACQCKRSKMDKVDVFRQTI
jgi:hypothetical protein